MKGTDDRSLTANDRSQVADVPEKIPCAPTSKEEKDAIKDRAAAIHEHELHGHAIPLPAKYGSCDVCDRAFAVDKPARRGDKHSDDRSKANVDLLDMLHPDANDRQMCFDLAIMGTKYGKAKMLNNRSSASTAKAWTTTKAFIESHTDPGGKSGYKITACRHDPGSEFNGAFKSTLAKDNVIDDKGEVDRHSDGGCVEARNKRIQRVATAIAIQCCGENIDLYNHCIAGEAIEWASEIVNHTMITQQQKNQGMTAHQDQFNNSEILTNAYGIEVVPFGTLCYIYVKKQDREGKVAERAIRAIWAGANEEHAHSIKAMPIKLKNGVWEIMPTVHNAKVKIIHGKFPLKNIGDVSEDLEKQVMEPEMNDFVVQDELDEGEYEIDQVLDHNQLGPREYEYEVSWKGYGPEDNWWKHQDDLSGAQGAIAEYWRTKVIGEVGIVEPGENGVILCDGEVTTTPMYARDLKTWLGNDFDHEDTIGHRSFMDQTIVQSGNDRSVNDISGDRSETISGGVEEIKLKKVDDQEVKDKIKEAHDREIQQMIDRRFVREGTKKANKKGFIPAHKLTETQKAGAKKCRMSYTQKRPTPEEKEQGLVGKYKARLVCMDLKVIHTLPKEVTYSPTPTAESFRLVVASVDVNKGDNLSATDFDTAFLQAQEWADDRLLLICYLDEFTGEWMYEWIDGVIYGMQEGSRDWKDTLCFRLVHDLGFKEVKNMQSVYYHTEKQITIPVHVDDPLVKARGTDSRDWFHTEINKIFDTKGVRILDISTTLDYLSMNISLTESGDIQLDNRPYIEKVLDEEGMSECNAAKEPLTKSTLDFIGENKRNGIKVDDETFKSNERILGKAQWLAQTTHPTIATAVGILSSLVKEKWRGTDMALKHLLRYLKGAKDLCLRNTVGENDGLEISSDADWAGLYKLLGEKRSRTGILVTYNGMPVSWKSSFQQCKGTEISPYLSIIEREILDEEGEISTSSAESETHAAADATKVAMHMTHICEEIGEEIEKPVEINIDAGAAMGFINNTGTIGRMKHIDLRQAWMDQVRDRSKVKFKKIAGPDNPADFFTKVITGPPFKIVQERLMKKIEQ